MASAKMFLGNKCSSNAEVQQALKPGTKYKITATDSKEVGNKSEPALAIQVQGHDLWIRCNKPSLKALIAKIGDDTDKWIGKQITIACKPTVVMGQPQIQVDITPV